MYLLGDRLIHIDEYTNSHYCYQNDVDSEARLLTVQSHVVPAGVAGVPHPGVDHLQVPDVVLDQLHHLVHSVAVTGDLPLRPPVPR